MKITFLQDQVIFDTTEMSRAEKEALVTKALQTPEGKGALRRSIQLAAAKAADQLPEGSHTWHLARKLAGLPPKRA